MTDRLTVSVKAAAEMLSCGRTTIYKLLNQGALDRVAVGRRTLVTTESIRRVATPAILREGAR